MVQVQQAPGRIVDHPAQQARRVRGRHAIGRGGRGGRGSRCRARELSKGMTQKLGLVSIGLSPCPIWVLDEPMSGLDPLARRHVARLIDGARRDGRTILFTSHGLRDLPALCDQLVVLHEGCVRFCGSPAQFSGQYGTDDLEAAFLQCVAPAAPEGGSAHRDAPAAQAMA